MARDLFGRHPEKLQELLHLRGDLHWPYVRLGKHFGKDHTTIIYNLRRFAPHLVGIVMQRTRADYIDHPLNVLVPARKISATHMRKAHRARMRMTVLGPTTPCVKLLMAPVPHPSMKYKHLIDDECIKVNPGKSYRQYRREAKLRAAEEHAARMAKLKREHEARVRLRGRLTGKRETGFNKGHGWF